MLVAVKDNNESYVELVSGLLQKGADPNLTDLSGFNALYWAIEKNNFEAIDLLAPVTMSNLGTTLEKLASNQLKISANVELFIARCAADKDVMEAGMIAASKYGNARMLQILQFHPCTFELSKLSTMLQTAIESDCQVTCQEIQ